MWKGKGQGDAIIDLAKPWELGRHPGEAPQFSHGLRQHLLIGYSTLNGSIWREIGGGRECTPNVGKN